MRSRVRRLRRALCLLGAGAAVALPCAVGAAPAGAAVSHALIQGSGSSWSANAVNQWIADVQPQGLQVVYTASGSAQGRKDFALKTTDFAVSDIGYQGHDQVTGDTDTSQGRGYAYLPVVAGGTSFPYQVRVGGQLVRNLRLSGETIAKIFTNQITNWDDPAITKDNNGRKLPSLSIIPVIHSEGSGSTAQFTTYLNTMFPSLWRPFFGRAGLTEYYPRKGNAIAQNGSDGVMNFISSAAANGAIGYDEYSYALAKNYPVAKMLNAAGYFTLPNQYNVAVALTQAQINMNKNSQDYLLQKLDHVYTYNDVRTYPLSSYSYMIIPTASDDAKMTTAKRQTLADYLNYAICIGQKEMGPIGYSPLPINLVQAGFAQIGKLKQADSGVDLSKHDVSSCHNPTFIAGQPSRNYLAEIAPKPAACDRVGQGPCAPTASTRDPGTENPGAPGAPGGPPVHTSPGSAHHHGSAGGSSGGSTPGGTGGTGSSGSVPLGSGSTSPSAVDPVTGQPAGTTSGTTTGDAATLAAVPTVIGQQQGISTTVLAVLAGLMLVAVIAVPPLVSRRLQSGGREE